MPQPQNSEYVPGVCNIGPAERAKRRQGGYVGLVIAVILLGVLIALGAPKTWRLLVILPAFIAATGFLQDQLHFCAGFGLRGLYNVARSAGDTENVISEDFRRQDKRKARTIFGVSIVIAIAIGVVSLIL
jgi:hypothetical protein